MTVPQLSPAPELTEAEKATVDRNRLAEALDDLALMHTGRSLGVLGSARIVDDLLDAEGGPLAHVMDAFAVVGAVQALADELDEKPHAVSPIVPRVDVSRRIRAALRGDRAPLAGQHTTDEEREPCMCCGCVTDHCQCDCCCSWTAS